MHRVRWPEARHAPASGGLVRIDGDAARYLRDVLRLRVGSPVEVFDGQGHAWPAEVQGFGAGTVDVVIGPRVDRPSSGVEIRVLQGLPKGDKFEELLQKCAELGVATVVPLSLERSVVRLTADKAADRVERWQRIADEACRQCHRADTLWVAPVQSLDAWLAASTGGEGTERIVLDEEERDRGLSDWLHAPRPSSPATIELLIGPEGGLSRDEVVTAQRSGFVGVSLGNRILRTQTVAPVLAGILQLTWGDLGRSPTAPGQR